MGIQSEAVRGSGETADDVPREEKSYKLFYPDLVPTAALPLTFERSHGAAGLDERFAQPKPAKPIPPAEYAAERTTPYPPRFVRTAEYLRAADGVFVEYDMDDRDAAWAAGNSIGHDDFERAVDFVEKEWFRLTADLQPAQKNGSFDEDGNCVICDDGECENVNAIVFCDGCNIAVHQECYGIPFIPEGQWICRRCLHPEVAAVCVLCGNSGGAFKQTTTNGWVHVLCAVWIPEVSVGNVAFMEPIDISAIPKQRQRLVCSLCRRSVGACIQCSNRACCTAFHPFCARSHGLYMSHDRVYCQKHCPQSFSPRRSRMSAMTRKCAPNSPADDPLEFNPTKPIVPQAIFDKLVAAFPALGEDALAALCRYWALKRHARGGAPLLRRLFVAPLVEKASAAARIAALGIVRLDLERLRVLCDQVRRRELKKHEYFDLEAAALRRTTAPLHFAIKSCLQELVEHDKNAYFHGPVDTELVPDYLHVVASPLDLSVLREKNDMFLYESLDEFAVDIDRVWSNCMLYNKRDTVYFKAALEMETFAAKLLSNLMYSEPKPQRFFSKADLYAEGDDRCSSPVMQPARTVQTEASDFAGLFLPVSGPSKIVSSLENNKECKRVLFGRGDYVWCRSRELWWPAVIVHAIGANENPESLPLEYPLARRMSTPQLLVQPFFENSPPFWAVQWRCSTFEGKVDADYAKMVSNMETRCLQEVRVNSVVAYEEFMRSVFGMDVSEMVSRARIEAETRRSLRRNARRDVPPMKRKSLPESKSTKMRAPPRLVGGVWHRPDSLHEQNVANTSDLSDLSVHSED